VKPTVVLCEVYKKIRRERTEDEALAAASVINRTKIVPLSESIALLAADLSIKYSLPMADAMVYATPFEEDCQVVTGDAHFRDLERVIFVA
jgi:predicted nucleic acid-binding protein